MTGTATRTDGQARVAAIYARVSSERQRQEQTIQSQTAALRELAEQRELIVPEEFIFEDDGFSGASLHRPALERLRDRAFEGCFEVVLCHAPDRLARRYAYQVLVLDELARGGIEVVFIKEPEWSGSPEDELLRQFQGMIAEYERAQIAERCRRGKLASRASRCRVGALPRALRLPVCEEDRARRRVLRNQRATILAELGDTHRFQNSRDVVRYGGLDITVKQSDQHRAPGHLSRQGPPALRWALYEAAQVARRPGSPDRDYYLQTAERIGGNRACLAVARKLLKRCYHTLRELGDHALTPA